MKNPVFSWIGTVVTMLITAISTMELKDLISWALSIIAAGITIAFTIWCWYKKAKADGKITKDEVDDLIDSLTDKGGKKNE